MVIADPSSGERRLNAAAHSCTLWRVVDTDGVVPRIDPESGVPRTASEDPELRMAPKNTELRMASEDPEPRIDPENRVRRTAPEDRMAPEDRVTRMAPEASENRALGPTSKPRENLENSENRGFVVLQAASALEYALPRYAFSIMSANAYARLHGYRHFLYTSPEVWDPDRADYNRTRWLQYLFPKKNGTLAVFDLIDQEQAPERAVLFVDFDGWFNHARHANYSLEALEARQVEARTPAAGFDVILQGEPGLNSGVMVVYKTPSGRQFWHDIEAVCGHERRGRHARNKQTICAVSPWEQLGFFRVVFRHVNGTAGLMIAGDACLDSDWMCGRHAYMGFGLEENARVRWPHFAFVPKTGRPGQPQLHGCLVFRNCLPLRESIWYHTGHPAYAELAVEPERTFRYPC